MFRYTNDCKKELLPRSRRQATGVMAYTDKKGLLKRTKFKHAQHHLADSATLRTH